MFTLNEALKIAGLPQKIDEGVFQCSLTLEVPTAEFKQIRADMKAAGVPALEWSDTTRLFSDNKAAVAKVEKYLKSKKIKYTKELE